MGTIAVVLVFQKIFSTEKRWVMFRWVPGAAARATRSEPRARCRLHKAARGRGHPALDATNSSVPCARAGPDGSSARHRARPLGMVGTSRRPNSQKETAPAFSP